MTVRSGRHSTPELSFDNGPPAARHLRTLFMRGSAAPVGNPAGTQIRRRSRECVGVYAPRARYIIRMSTYVVLPRQRQPGYKVEVVTDSGTRHTILGFETEEDAYAWVEADRKLEQAFGKPSY
jgi:hypothetical protein